MYAIRSYYVRSGAIAVELAAPGREPMVLQTLADGEILGSSWIVPPYRWLFDARAVQLTRVVSLDAKCLRGKCEADHSLGFDLMKRFTPVLSQRLQAARLVITSYSIHYTKLYEEGSGVEEVAHQP